MAPRTLSNPKADTTDEPKVSVIMPVRNCAAFAGEAVASILEQDLRQLELIIVDDASTDGTLAVVRNAASDPRVRVLRNDKHTDISRCINLAVDLARAPFIARMDGDDVAHPSRLSRQLEFIENHPQIDLCGTQIELFGAACGVRRFPEKPEIINAALIFRNTIAHPTVMARGTFFREHRYDPEYPRAQDWELWSRQSGTGRFANLSDALLKYRVHDKQIGAQHPEEYVTCVRRILLRNIREMLGNLSIAELAGYRDLLTNPESVDDPATIAAANKILVHLLRHNQAINRFEGEALRLAVEEAWFSACARSRLTPGAGIRAMLSGGIGSLRKRVRASATFALRRATRQMEHAQ